MGQVSSAFDPAGQGENIANYTIPPFPSLYNPSFKSTVQQSGYFLHDANAIWRFTFYWTLILLFGTFEVCAALASFNLLIGRTVFTRSPPPEYTGPQLPDHSATSGDTPGTRFSFGFGLGRSSRRTSRFHSRKRPPLWLILLIPIVMGSLATLVALVSGTVVGFALAAVYSSGGFSMSTWVPFMWALIQVVLLIISSYSSLTRIL